MKRKQTEIAEIKNDNSQYVFIKDGSFLMGSPESEPEHSFDEIQHQVTVSDFYISKTEISQQEYQKVMGNNLLVTNITWYETVQYCNKLTQKEGFTPFLEKTVTWNKKNADGYRLHTEAEWEYAARANTPFSFGDYVNDDDTNCYNSNDFGLYNMHGNAAEWVCVMGQAKCEKVR